MRGLSGISQRVQTKKKEGWEPLHRMKPGAEKPGVDFDYHEIRAEVKVFIEERT